MNDVTQLLNAIDQGDPTAAAQLLPLVYDELRRLAAQRLAHEPSGQTLQPTALVHEAYLRLGGTHDGPGWTTRAGTPPAPSPRRRPRRCAASSSTTPAANKHPCTGATVGVSAPRTSLLP